MKYLAILVLLAAPLIAQEPVKGGYIDALNKMDAECKPLVQAERIKSRDVWEKIVADQHAKDVADYNELAEKYNALVERNNALLDKYREHLASDRSRTSPSTVTVVRESAPLPLLPAPAQPLRCVASSSPLGTSTITSVNCQ